MLLSLYLAVLDDQSDEEQFIDAAVDEQAALDALETFAQNWTINIPRSQSRGGKTGRTSAPTSNILRKSAV